MKTYPTLDAARLSTDGDGVQKIAEIEHATEGRCFIRIKCAVATLRVALAGKPMAEIKSLIAEHPPHTPAQDAARREEILRTSTKCERCAKKIDGNTAYSQQEQYMGHKVTAWYCDSCRGLLANIGMGEFDGLQERASAGGSRERYTKEDF
jgi:hypothetical protein